MRDDDRLGQVLGAVVGRDHALVAADLDAGDFAPGDLDAELGDLLLHVLRHLAAGDGLDGRVVLDQLGVEQLAAARAHTVEERGS